MDCRAKMTSSPERNKNVHERNLKQLCNIYTFKTALPLIKLGLKIVLNNKQIGSYEKLCSLC